jgi:alpha-tubulin suppressor-like RCC1 family protein
MIATGVSHTLAVKEGGTLWAWGNNDDGQLGDSSYTQRLAPTQIGTDSDWAQVAAGDYHSLAIKEDGTLWAWGSNFDGQIGINSADLSISTPTQVGTDEDWAQIAAGADHSLAIKTNGSLWAWGSDNLDQLGFEPGFDNQLTPVQIGATNDWAQVTAGAYHSLAIKTDKTLWAWGSDVLEQLGNGAVTGNYLVPTQIGTDIDWARVSAGENHTLALKTTGTLWAWGSDGSGQLGNDAAGSLSTPTQVGTDVDWSQIAAGGFHSLAIKTNNSLWTWGDNQFGQLGDSFTTDRQVPTLIGVATWTQGAINSYHSLALRSDGTIWGWGDNSSGVLSDGAAAEPHVPEDIGFSIANAIPAGSVTIGGTATQGQTLNASNNLTDVDGLGVISYQWNRAGTPVADATAETYTLTQADVGSVISVTASYTDILGTAESVTSNPTAKVANVNDSLTGTVDIDGIETQGETLTASNTLADSDGLGTISYQWNRAGSPVAGATAATYSLTQDDVGSVISVTASYTDGLGTAESKTSAATGTIANTNDPLTGSVDIDGIAVQGETLTASDSLADIDGLGTVSYQWNRAGAPISGATANTYTLVQADIGSTISVTASYTDGQGTAESKTSGATATVLAQDSTIDSDGDSIPDAYESLNGLNPDEANVAGQDTDSDGFSDYQEYLLGLDPLVDNSSDQDTDGDGMIDQVEIYLGLDPLVADATDDPDADGLTNAEEIASGTLPLVANDTLPDSDGDRIPDTAEILAGLDPTVDNSTTDTDGDLVSDLVEYFNGTLAIDNGDLLDIDNDDLPDSWELANGLDPATSNNLVDSDNDGLTDLTEYQLGTNPKLADSDADGLDDQAETQLGTDPNLADSDADGVVDGADSFPTEATKVANGDADMNGTLEVVDALLTLRISVGLESQGTDTLKYADVAPFIDGNPNPDGQLNAADALVILRKVVGLVNW